MKFSNLTTERLFLRELRLDDAGEIFRLRSNKDVNDLIGRQSAVTIDDAIKFIHMIQGKAANDESVLWAITLAGDPKLIGTVLYWNIELEKNKAELGYELLPEHWGKGIMKEALEKVVEFGFKELKFRMIMADPNERNGKSIRLLEALGFELKGRDGEYLVYCLSSGS
ncbi:MAG: GNAT family N-acetyltransferase [Mucilaginibacter sp.]